MRLRSLARTLVAWEVLFLALLLPLVLAAPPLLAAALLVIPLFWLLRKAAYGHFVPGTPLNGSLLLLLLTVLVSLFATFDPLFSFPKVAGLVYGIALFYAVAHAASRTARRLWLAVGLFLLAGLGAGTLSLIGTQWPSKIPLFSTLIARMPPRLLSLPGSQEGFNPNEVAGVLLWFAPLALVLAVAMVLHIGRLRRQLPRQALLALLLIVVPLVALVLNALLLLTQSRAGLLGWGVALGAVLLSLARSHRSAVMVLALLALLGGAAIALWGIEPLNERLFAQAEAGDLELEMAMNSLEGRREIWSRALYGIEDFPLSGIGMGTFRRAMPVLYPPFLIPPDHDIAHAHNHLLQTALDLGLPGLVAYVAIWFGAVAMLWQSWRETTSSWFRFLAVGLSASLLAYFVYGLLDTVALGARPSFLFWFLLGLVAALYRLVTHPLP